MNGRQVVSYMGASILLSEKTLSVMPLCVMPPPPKGGGFARSSPLGGAGTALAVTERVLVFTHTHLILYENA